MSIEQGREEAPRQWHVDFTCNALRKIAFEQTDRLLSGLGDPLRAPLLPAAVMRCTAQDCGMDDEEAGRLAAGIRLHARTIGVIPLHVFEMPAPQAAGEVWYAAVVNLFTAVPGVRLFLLERTPGGGTALCSRDGAGGRAIVATGVETSVDALAAAIEAALRADGASLCDRAPAHAAPATRGDMSGSVSRENLTIELLRSVFEQALIDVATEPDGSLVVRDGGVTSYVYVPAKQKEYFTLRAGWTLRSDLSPEARANCLARINEEYLFVRATVSGDPAALWFTLEVPVFAGITRLHAATMMRRFSYICSAAIGEHAKGLLS